MRNFPVFGLNFWNDSERNQKKIFFCCLLFLFRRPPAFDTIGTMPNVPLNHGKPTEDDMRLIAERLMRGEARTSWKSIPPALRVSWHAVLSRIAEWDNVWALLLAPAVLLQRHGGRPRLSSRTAGRRTRGGERVTESGLQGAQYERWEQMLLSALALRKRIRLGYRRARRARNIAR